jgi:(E)-4-hydroxy-3-methylbut-2-enyl-diphosphate synthase
MAKARSFRESLFPRRRTKQILVGGVPIGGGAPVAVQSMTKTDTRDIRATLRQIRRLEKAGCEIVRLAVPDLRAARALREIKAGSGIPVIADIHFDHRLALVSIGAGVDGLRINPGNIGSKAKVGDVVRAARERGLPIRIGVNSGSLEKSLLRKYGGVTAEAMVESALGHIRILEDLDFSAIKVSLKASDVPRTLEAYRLLAERTDYPFHAGITEAGGLLAGSIKSSAGLSLLLAEGLADTIRVSLTAPPEREVEAAWRILRSLGIRPGGIDVVSCPTCGRCEVDLRSIASGIEKRLAPLSGHLTVAVMGCMVNGPGEAREADVGVACGRGAGVIFRNGRIVRRVPEDRIVEALAEEITTMTIIEDKEKG